MKRIIATPEAGRVQQGFTLVELMIVVAIVAILAAVGYPSYMQYTIKANRSAAQSYMLGVANTQERYMLDARQYFSTIGLMRAKVKIGMMNLVYNMVRLGQLIRRGRRGAPAMA